jgi:hypothetical protein
MQSAFQQYKMFAKKVRTLRERKIPLYIFENPLYFWHFRRELKMMEENWGNQICYRLECHIVLTDRFDEFLAKRDW